MPESLDAVCSRTEVAALVALAKSSQRATWRPLDLPLTASGSAASLRVASFPAASLEETFAVMSSRATPALALPASQAPQATDSW